MKLEEWAIIFHRLKTGQYRPGYERLKLPELVSIFQQYEGERAERREANWGELKKATPNNLDDETYILRLIKQVITVSLETVEIVNNLPPLEILHEASTDT